ncbi:MAG TPA: indole-3-glycerol phosphate synthase TrpC [Gemmatimonadales bacterium]|nr:indole-3-glycerol phosphate synthase TrpC [Gemmatimonadales bacterium]
MKLPEGTPKRNPDVLSRILAETRRTLDTSAAHLRALESELRDARPPRRFGLALRSDRVAVIAEIKRRSPSAGEINAALDPVDLATAYATGGAAAISVLTEGPHFGGSLTDLRAVSSRVSCPTLRKDFILDRVQLLEARAGGAAAALLIVRALPQRELIRLLAAAREIGLEALVEAHDELELARAVDAGADIIGVNARNLDDFSMDAATALELIARIPRHLIAVAESGMSSEADVLRAAAAGADAVLVGGALAAAREPARLVRTLAGVPRHGR